MKPTQIMLVTAMLLVGEGAALTCKGRPSLVQGYTNMCMTNSALADSARSQTCLTSEIANNALTCTASDECTEVNIGIKTGYFGNTDDMVWSVAGCYKQQMSLLICSDGQTIETTTVDSSNPTTAGVSAGVTDVSGPGGNGGTTAETSGSPSLPDFNGCISTTVSFTSATCAAVVKPDIMSAYYTDSSMTTLNGMVKVSAQVLGCCDTDNCRVDDGVDRPNTCYFGDEETLTSVSCVNECFGYLYIDGSTTTAQFGCLEDLDLAGTSYQAATTCTDDYKDGTCSSANGHTECLRCCEGSKCNDWEDKDELLDMVETATQGASAALPSLLLFVTTALALIALH